LAVAPLGGCIAILGDACDAEQLVGFGEIPGERLFFQERDAAVAELFDYVWVGVVCYGHDGKIRGFVKRFQQARYVSTNGYRGLWKRLTE
jgi:hypothetical protein